ncbi:MAG: FeoB-associated Cys-rich membrane protein [Ruminococcus sp.]|nr:FeoB-associated Cys-rich membrane protein [Ruminococcus sp.]
MGTIIICAVLVLIVSAIILNMIKEKKKGRSPVCGGSCGHCPMNCKCGSLRK